MIEFTDFSCGHCQAYNQETEESILKDYVATGKVLYVAHYYSFAHPRSLQAAEAAMCAADQGLYFQLQHALFEDEGAASRADFIALAQEVGLDKDAFIDCWDTGRHHNALMEHSRAANAQGISSTPSFIINERLVVGNRPDLLAQAIEEELAAVGR
jgi:protein-disulfide isomerase